MGITPERERIARRVAHELKDGWVVNLGIGIPTLVANYIPNNVNIILQSENGLVGLGPAPEEGNEDPDLTNAGGQPVTILDGGAFFDSAFSFAIIRGGHLDATVLGALQVDAEGNLANYTIPNKFMPGMGGAMDLTVGAKTVIVATEHCTKKGDPKILKRCTLPLTAVKEVNLIVTELAVFEVIENGLLLKEIFEGISLEELKTKTHADFKVSDKLITFA